MCGSTGLLALHAVTILLSVSNHSHRHVGPVRLRYGRNLHSTPRTAGSAARPYVIVTPGAWLAGRRHARPLRTVWCARARGGWFILVRACGPAGILVPVSRTHRRGVGWSVGQGVRPRRPLWRFDPPTCATWTWLDGSLDAPGVVCTIAYYSV